MKDRSSELTLEYVDKAIDSFSPIRVYYNKKIIFDDMVDAMDEGDMLADYRSFMEKNKEKNVYKIKIEIREFHHSYVWITGD